MKGFLQRIAAGAMKPGGAVRPIVGSVFEGARTTPVLPSLDAVMEAPVRSERAGEQERRGEERAKRRRGEDERESSGENISGKGMELATSHLVAESEGKRRAAAATGAPFPDRRWDAEFVLPPVAGERRPLASADTGSGSVNPAGADESLVPGEAAAAPLASMRESRSAAPAEPQPVSGPLRSPIAPLVAGDFPVAPVVPGRSAPAEAGSGGLPPPRRAPEPKAEPEQIEISIGRIEVTAAPPAVVRAPAPRNPNRAPSLDDYLKRRNSRYR
jgi:hypothetical protein